MDSPTDLDPEPELDSKPNTVPEPSEGPIPEVKWVGCGIVVSDSPVIRKNRWIICSTLDYMCCYLGANPPLCCLLNVLDYRFSFEFVDSQPHTHLTHMLFQGNYFLDRNAKCLIDCGHGHLFICL